MKRRRRLLVGQLGERGLEPALDGRDDQILVDEKAPVQSEEVRGESQK